MSDKVKHFLFSKDEHDDRTSEPSSRGGRAPRGSWRGGGGGSRNNYRGSGRGRRGNRSRGYRGRGRGGGMRSYPSSQEESNDDDGDVDMMGESDNRANRRL